MSSLLVHSEQKARESEWARLIPGQVAAVRGGVRKQPQSVRTLPFGDLKTNEETETSFGETLRTLLLPSPVPRWTGWKWVRSLFSDFALVAVDWLVIGALLVPLHAIFPRVGSFGYAAGAPVSLLGIALLHAALITLVAHSEGLYTESDDERDQAKTLGKSVWLATTVLCFGYGLQGAPWTTSGLFCTAGLLHFGTMWFWRCRSREREHHARAYGGVRNVLIVGAGGVGRRVAAYVEQHPAAGRRVCGFIDDDRPLGNGVIGHVADLARLARKEFIDEVIMAAPHNREMALEVLREARQLRLDLEVVPELFGCKPAGREMERVGGLPVICLHAERLPAVGLVLKRLIDMAVAGLALTMLSPWLALIAILIKLDREVRFFIARNARDEKAGHSAATSSELWSAMPTN